MATAAPVLPAGGVSAISSLPAPRWRWREEMAPERRTGGQSAPVWGFVGSIHADTTSQLDAFLGWGSGSAGGWGTRE